MKKYLVFIFTLLFTFVLASCDLNKYYENTWFSNESLQKCIVDELPEIKDTDYVNVNDQEIYMNLAEDEYEDYVETVYEYLKTQDYRYLGTRGEQNNTLAGVMTTYFFKEANSLEEFRDKYHEADYRFVYSDGTKEETYGTVFNIIFFDRNENGILKYKNKSFNYNTRMRLSHRSETALSHLYVLDEETEYKDEIIEAYKSKYNLEYNIEISKIYGVFYKDSKLVIPFIQGGPGDAVAWGETVANIYFYYGDHHRIEVYYDNDFYTLQEAYDNGLLTRENIIEMARNDENHCKMGHSWYENKCLVCGELKLELETEEVFVENPYTQYIRTGYSSLDADNYQIITSYSELNWYYQNNKDICNLERNDPGNAIDLTIGFLDAIDKYNTKWFEENALVLIPLIESSGSITHTITSYNVIAGILKINIKSNIPESGTEDMMGWHLIMEVNKIHIHDVNCVEIYKDNVLLNEVKNEVSLSYFHSFLENYGEKFVEVQYVNYRGSIAPGVLQETKFSTNRNDIDTIFNYFKNVKLTKTIVEQEKMEPGMAFDYYVFITENGQINKISLYPYRSINFTDYVATFDVPEMKNYTQANNLLSHSIVYDAYYTTNNTFKIDEINYINELMIKQYIPSQYYMSDMLYVDYEGCKLRIIDSTHFEYNNKYYEILGNVTFKDLIDKTAPYSYYRGEQTVSLVYTEVVIAYAKEIIYMTGQTMYVSEIVSLVNRYQGEGPGVEKYIYLDPKCTIQLTEDKVIEDDLTLYISYKSPTNEDGVYC